MFAFTHFSLAAAVLAPVLSAQAAKMLVQVGPEGQQIFSPSNITANVGDVVSFAFLTKNHSVTESSFASPVNRWQEAWIRAFSPWPPMQRTSPSSASPSTTPPSRYFSSRHKRFPPTSAREEWCSPLTRLRTLPNRSPLSKPLRWRPLLLLALLQPPRPRQPSRLDRRFLCKLERITLASFSPSNISANIGDIVTFQFVSKNHSVTQTTFAKPCSALLAGGADSGFRPALLNAPNVAATRDSEAPSRLDESTLSRVESSHRCDFVRLASRTKSTCPDFE
ncbi:hypothetical protein B0H14DRAFT_3152221 [Mycena olivaceomarginata]|nr:hypothetical protein B0H14DRAFT_3152221 [Mycena olivaceomarginata]